MNLEQIWNQVKQLFAQAGIQVESLQEQRRTIASAQLYSSVREKLEELNQPAYKLDSATGYMYTDYEKYLSAMDVYYDNDGSVFLLCSRAGKLYRVPITVSEDGTEVSLSEPVEIPLTGRDLTNRSSIKIFRLADGTVRWFSVAASAVLNRVNEIDSTQLFDHFISRAQDTKKYPFLSFYHETGTIRLGQADWLARSEYLYLASGTFDDSADAKRAADTLEKDTEGIWGNSIGYQPLGAPELLEVARGISVPVYNDGINEEISIVLERDAAAYFTHMGTEEVTRSMSKKEFDALVLMFGEPRAKEMAAEIDSTNRSIVEKDQIRREGVTSAPPVAEMTTTPVAAQAETQTRETEAAALTAAVPATFEFPEEMFNALANALAEKLQPTIQASADTLLATLDPRLTALETSARSLETTTNDRFAALEQDDEAKRKRWTQDMPRPTKQTFVLRPRETRAAPQENQQLDLAAVAQQTTGQMKTRQPATAGK